MVSVLRTLQAEWNALVPQAQSLNIRRVRTLNAPLETIEYRRTKLDWLRGELARLSSSTSLTPSVSSFDLDGFTFGVELEFILGSGLGLADAGRMALVRRIMEAGVECRSEGYNHNTTQAWKLTTDGSVDSSYSHGFELVSPVLRGAAGFAQVQKVCDVLKATGCKVNKKCGLHVHVGAGDWQLPVFKNLVRLYASAETAIDSFMAPSRRGSANLYAQAMIMNANRLNVATTMEEIATAICQDHGPRNVRGHRRYRKINLQCFWQHGTVEFRQHQGTIEADKVINWTRLCLRMCAAAKAGHAHAPAFAELFDTVRAPASERAFFQGRVDFFRAQENHAAQRNDPLTERLEAARREGTIRSYEPAVGTQFQEIGADLQRRATTRGQG